MGDVQTETGALIDLASLPNLRDIGGYAVPGGHVRNGLLYRSVALDKLTPHDAAELARRGIRTVFDLRTRAERSSAPDHLPVGATGVVCDVLADAVQATPARMLEVIKNPQLAAEAFGRGRATPLFHDAYRKIVSSASALRAYRKFFTDMGQDGTPPVLFHCTTGKDRTGWAAAATLLLLGVGEHDVFRDYELTNRDLLPTFGPLFSKFADSGGNPDILRPVLGVDPSYLETALDEMSKKYGSISGYFREGLGIDEDQQDHLRVALTA